MPLIQRIQENELTYGIWKVSETVDELLSKFGDRQSFYASQLEQFRYDGRRLEWLAVRALLKEMLGEECEIGYKESGKPYLINSKWNVSISHTRGYVTVALSLSRIIGIDIEQYGNRVCKIAKRFIREDENCSVENARLQEPLLENRENMVYAMLLHWSAKESIFKIMEQIDVDFLHNLQIYPFNLCIDGSFKGKEYGSPERKEFLIRYLLHPDFVLTYAINE